jgi:geranylgeranyl reductase family protein
MMHDVVIVGAGPGGSAAAHTLARQGLDVLLLDKADFPRDKTCGDAVTPRGLAALADMGILDALLRLGNCIPSVDVFAPGGHAVAAPVPKQAGRPDYFLVMPRIALDDALRARVLASGARFESMIHVTDAEADGKGVTIRGEYRGKAVSFRARAAIIATGASTRLLVRMGLLKRPPTVIMLAARAYFENVSDLRAALQFRFDGAPLPGYGWVFPLSGSAANVGVGFFPIGRAARRLPDTPRVAFDAFVESQALREMLSGAQRSGPVKGYPIRLDFVRAPTFGERVLLVGEAAGLANPLTGEGIDYALESGKLAGEHLGRVLARGDISRQDLEAYDQLLRRRFQELFIFCERIRRFGLNRLLLDRLVSAAARRPDLKMALTDVVLGNQEAAESVSVRTLLNVITLLIWPAQSPLEASR